MTLPDGTPAAAIVRSPFHGTEIHTTIVDGEPHVVIRPTVEGRRAGRPGERGYPGMTAPQPISSDAPTVVVAQITPPEPAPPRPEDDRQRWTSGERAAWRMIRRSDEAWAALDVKEGAR